ncbi:cobalt ECF transporter T component CbiQ [soil metagenome]
MRLDLLERQGQGESPLHRLDARCKLLGALAFVVAVVVVPVGVWWPLTVAGLVLAFGVGLSGISTGLILRRWLIVLPLVVFVSAMIAPTHPARAEVGAWAVALSIIARNGLALLTVLLLAGVTPFPALLQALRRLRVPTVLVATLHFMYRYLFVLTEELGRMLQARRSRTFRRSSWIVWNRNTGLIGALFLRSFERGERVHAAMLARGWDGKIRTLDPDGTDD